MKEMLKATDCVVEDLKKQGIGLDSNSDNSSNENEDNVRQKVLETNNPGQGSSSNL